MTADERAAPPLPSNNWSKVVLTLIAAVICAACSTGGSTTASRATAEPTTSGSTLSGLIAFSFCDANNVSQIVLAGIDGSNQRVLTQGQNSSYFPAWSPDESQLLFTRMFGNVPQVWVMKADGSKARALVAAPSLGGSWSTDGKRIAYSYGVNSAPPLKIWIAQADGNRAKRLTTSGPSVFEFVPRWSPDGTKIVFFANNPSGHFEIWVADVASGVARPLTQSYFDPGLQANIEQKVPAWAPDGKLIAYWAGVEFNDHRPNLPRNVWVMNADGTDQKQLVAGDDPDWSPKGDFIIHSMGGPEGRPALGIVRPDGTDARTLFKVRACVALQSSWINEQ